MTPLFIQKLLHEQVDIGKSRSSTLNPLQWLLIVLISALIAALMIKNVPSWALWLLGAAVTAMLLLFAYTFIYLLHTDKDALRSEQFVLTRMAIEKNSLGDSESGYQEVAQFPNGMILEGLTGAGEEAKTDGA